MASAEASSSRAARVDTPPTPGELASLTSLLVEYYAADTTKVDSVTRLYLDNKQSHNASQRSLETTLLSQAPSYLKLNHDIGISKRLLEELESFLHVFSNDLNTLSNQMKTLQGKSVQLGSRLQNRRQLETKLRELVNGTVLEPRFVDMVFSDEATMGKISLDAWKECAEKLSSCIRACEGLEESLREDLKVAGITDIKALQEAKEVIEGCRIMAVTKIRPILISTFAPLRSSLSTNMPILQSILLTSYRPLYSFLSHHAPRVAIDVQRSYVAAARLYFETGFRRYERSLGKLRDRESSRNSMLNSSEVASASSFVEVGKVSSVLGSILPGSTSSTSAVDPWRPDIAYLENAKTDDGPAVTLAYLADDAAHRAPVEALFRSLTLTFLDNATSEYCFLARFFEGVDMLNGTRVGAGGSTIVSSIDSTTDTSKIIKEDRTEIESSDGPLPEESASVRDGDGEEEEVTTIAGTVVSLSEIEKRRLRGRGAIDALWKQVMEPVMGTYNTFVTSVLTTQPSLLSLYTMLKLNDNVLEAVQNRGASSILQGTFMTFRLKAWPIIQKQFDEVIEGVKKVKGDESSGSYLGLGSIGGLFGSASGVQAGKDAQDAVFRLICARYARLYSSLVKLNSTGEEDSMIFANLIRLRNEVERLLAKVERGQRGRYYEVILTGLETGPAGLIHPRMQSEISHWREIRQV
ncbi:hypothetical protein CBS101457_001732 [Exobasidium rhododendri]|nr:hypothetical protein CBS101457_001732 [Exobasidium rhododendri]